ncbi:MAG: macro domain-containing protein [Deferribacterales bacterium]
MGVNTEINGTALEVILRDITKQPTDAIVNAANTKLHMGAGVAGAILLKGGKVIQEECDRIGSCPLGGAVITTGGRLLAKYVIHAVGPRYGIDPEPEKYLKSAIIKSIELADEYNLNTIAIPAISTGVFRYPLADAAKVIVGAVLEKMHSGIGLKKIALCLYSENDYSVFKTTLDKMK